MPTGGASLVQWPNGTRVVAGVGQRSLLFRVVFLQRLVTNY